MDKADSSRQVSKWETLDRDILAIIFGKLDIRDLTIGASRVCIYWFLASHNKTLWNTVDLANRPQVDKGLSFMHNLKKINNFFYLTEARTSLEFITKLSRSVPKNLFFHFNSSIEQTDLMFAAERMPNIEKLVLPRWFLETKKSTRFAFSQWKNLKTLMIPHECHATGTFEFQTVGENCNNLTNLKYLGFLETETAEQIVSYLKNIKRLSLSCSFVSYKGVLLLITGLKKLVILNLSHCKELEKYDPETVTMDNLVQAATQKLVKFIVCSKNDCKICKDRPVFCMSWSYGIKHWRNDEIKELEF